MDRKIVEYSGKVSLPEGCNLIQLPPRSAKVFKGENYGHLFAGRLQELLADDTLQSCDRETLMAMFPYMQYGNFFSIPITKFSELIGKKQPNVSRTIKKLVEAGYLQPFSKKDRVTTYMIDPNLIYKGFPFKWPETKGLWNQINLYRNPDASLDGDII
jgi:DNA-binding transcriptional ArsR family regulator